MPYRVKFNKPAKNTSEEQAFASWPRPKDGPPVACTRVGSTIASGSCDCSVRLWDGATGQLERVLEAHTDWVASVAFSPDDALLVSGSRAGATVIQAETVPNEPVYSLEIDTSLL